MPNVLINAYAPPRALPWVTHAAINTFGIFVPTAQKCHAPRARNTHAMPRGVAPHKAGCPYRARHFNQCIRPTQGVALGYVQHLGLQPAPTICPFGAGNHSARQAYEIRPVVTVVGITIATFANAMLSYVVSVVVNNNPRARRAFCKTPFLACYLIRKA